MTDVEPFGRALLLIALIGTLAVLSNRFGERLRVPAPAIFLVGAAAASDIWPGLGALQIPLVEKVVTVALVVILFDGGMHIGRRRFREAAAATVWVGVAGTLVTAVALALLAHYAFGLEWRMAMLLGTALAPTDPAVVFSVLGRREITGRTGTLLEGESGANDPVGIALMVALLSAGGAGLSAVGQVTLEFLQQMAIGAAVGVAGGLALLAFMRRVPLPSAGLYALRVLFGALVIYGLGTAAHGSGFLAVFTAGIVLGDERAPYKREIERFHSALASLGEIVAFTLLGLTISLHDLAKGGAWWIGLVLAVALAFVIRPVFAGLVLWPVRLRRGERVFVLWTGLKGAVPILLGTFILQDGLKDAHRAYEIIFVVVAFSVIVQGGLVPTLAHRLGVPLRTVDPEPWSLGVRFQEEPEGLHRYQVVAGSPADGATVDDLPCGEDAWVSFVIREGRLVTVRGGTELRAGDEVLVLADDASRLADLFKSGESPED
ncbi:potassium/proton antiporter [Actinomadura sp. DC4]|uniref:potassium/proton antiporter n=1 Tax=Actinomadura sp. DC4 TaxID=3055069 RepID=UPI0025B20890|nr:potassium/proton antiporter [Actinomadura sp. DC4]MDN3353308.1 potassium/proton antiporter [Actinomadura sp. DC4]